MFEQTTFPAYFEKKQLLRESAERTARKAAALCAAMTVPEKLSLLGGDRAGRGTIANAGYLPGVPRFGVPEIRMYDGPAGVTAMRDTAALRQQGRRALHRHLDGRHLRQRQDVRPAGRSHHNHRRL